MAIEISVIIPCYGHANELEDCLYALKAQRTDVEFEVIVVDSSPDTSVEKIISKFPGVCIIRSQSRLFPGAGRNLGVKNARGAGLAFIDADCFPAPDWLQQACLSLRSGSQITGGPVLDPKPFHPIAWVDNRLQFSDFQAGRPAGKGEHFPSCNMAMARVIFEALGGFREDVPTGEDAALTSQAALRFADGMFYNPGMTVYHRGRREWGSFLKHQRMHGLLRAALRLHISPALERLARHPMLAGLVILRRLGYISLRTFQYDRRNLPRLILYLPLLLAGLAAWAQGFYRGWQAK